MLICICSLFDLILFYLFQNVSHGLFLGFRVVTLIPFEPKLIDVPRLSPHQVNNKVMSYCFNKRIQEEWSYIKSKVNIKLKATKNLRFLVWNYTNCCFTWDVDFNPATYSKICTGTWAKGKPTEYSFGSNIKNPVNTNLFSQMRNIISF